MTAPNCGNGSTSAAPKPVIPNKSNRKQPFSFDKKSYKQRHRIENAFCRLKDFRRIATRYDRLARNSSLPSASSLLSYGGFNEFANFADPVRL